MLYILLDRASQALSFEYTQSYFWILVFVLHLVEVSELVDNKMYFGDVFQVTFGLVCTVRRPVLIWRGLSTEIIARSA